jgi:ribosome maturation factor RimP
MALRTVVGSPTIFFGVVMLDLARIRQRVEEDLLPGGSEPADPWLVDIELTGDDKGRVVRFLVDTDAGITVEELARLNRSIGALLDQEELVGFSYRLEVCSPGLSRPLKHGRQLAKAVGRKVRVRWQSAEADMTRQRAAEGRLLAADDNHLHLETEAGPLALERSTVDDIVYKLDW